MNKKPHTCTCAARSRDFLPAEPGNILFPAYDPHVLVDYQNKVGKMTSNQASLDGVASTSAAQNQYKWKQSRNIRHRTPTIRKIHHKIGTE